MRVVAERGVDMGRPQRIARAHLKPGELAGDYSPPHKNHPGGHPSAPTPRKIVERRRPECPARVAANGATVRIDGAQEACLHERNVRPRAIR